MCKDIQVLKEKNQARFQSAIPTMDGNGKLVFDDAESEKADPDL